MGENPLRNRHNIAKLNSTDFFAFKLPEHDFPKHFPPNILATFLLPTYNSDDIVVAVVITPLQQTVDHLDDVVLRAPVNVVVVHATADFAAFAAGEE